MALTQRAMALGVDAVVGVDPALEGAGGVLVGEFERGSASVVFGCGAGCGCLAVPGLDDVGGGVGGAVVDEDDVEVRGWSRMMEARAVVEVVAGVVGGDDDGDGGLVRHASEPTTLLERGR